MKPVTELAIGKSRKRMVSPAVSCWSARLIFLIAGTVSPDELQMRSLYVGLEGTTRPS